MESSDNIRRTVAGLLIAAAAVCAFSCSKTTEENTSDTSFDDLTEISETESKEMIRPDLTEDEILNMSDEEFTEYALLLRDHCIEDVLTPNPQRNEFDFWPEAGYDFVGMPAPRSASNYDEALLIASEDWQDDLDNKYTDLSLLGENDKFWLFQCTDYYRGEFNLICTRAVYKKDYYDEETATAYFELNEESVRTFFAYRTADADDEFGTCIGEFVIKTDDGYIFRRYNMYISYGDIGLGDVVSLSRYGWKISNDGKVVPIISDNFGRSVDIPD